MSPQSIQHTSADARCKTAPLNPPPDPPPCPQALLDRIVAAATCAQTVRAFARRVRADPAPTSAVDADGATTTRRGGACGPTLQALAGCLNAELDAVMVDVRSAEQRLCANGNGTPCAYMDSSSVPFLWNPNEAAALAVCLAQH